MKVIKIEYVINNEGYELDFVEERDFDIDEPCDFTFTVYYKRRFNRRVPIIQLNYFDIEMLSAVKESLKLIDKLLVINQANMINNYVTTAFYEITNNIDEAIELTDGLYKVMSINEQIMRELENE